MGHHNHLRYLGMYIQLPFVLLSQGGKKSHLKWDKENKLKILNILKKTFLTFEILNFWRKCWTSWFWRKQQLCLLQSWKIIWNRPENGQSCFTTSQSLSLFDIGVSLEWRRVKLQPLGGSSMVVGVPPRIASSIHLVSQEMVYCCFSHINDPMFFWCLP